MEYFIKMNIFLFFLWNFSLKSSYAQLDLKIHLHEIKRYHIPYKSGKCVLKMNYASSKILNPSDWHEKINDVYQIKSVKLVFSKYPKEKKDWITNYDNLFLKGELKIYKHLFLN